MPDRYAHTTTLRVGASVESEEELTFWLWVWPGLLGWPRTINWLFSPVTGRFPHPGDLWGLDSRGELIIIETKIQRGRGVDPFEDFLRFTSRARVREPSPLDYGWLCKRWEGLLRNELDFIGKYKKRSDRGERRGETQRGVIPYSSRRLVLSRWPSLYWDRVAPRLESATYKAAVERSIRNRARLKDLAPRFVGLIACRGRSDRGLLSLQGETSQARLIAEVGSERVLLRAATATPTKVGRGIRIHTWTPKSLVG